MPFLALLPNIQFISIRNRMELNFFREYWYFEGDIHILEWVDYFHAYTDRFLHMEVHIQFGSMANLCRSQHIDHLHSIFACYVDKFLHKAHFQFHLQEKKPFIIIEYINPIARGYIYNFGKCF